MKLQRFVYEFTPSQNQLKIFNFKLIHQIKNVLRLGKDDLIVLVNPKEKKEYLFQITEISKNFIQGKILKVLNHFQKLNLPEITLFLAILKKENFEIACQKTTEIGVSKIIPLLTERTIKKSIPEKRILKIIQEAGEQSGRLDLPTLEKTLNFKDLFVLDYLKDSLNLVFHPQGEDLNHFIQFNRKKLQTKKVSIFVGPEGGFTEKEIKKFQENNFLILSLSNTILRAETAAIVGSYLALLFIKLKNIEEF